MTGSGLAAKGCPLLGKDGASLEQQLNSPTDVDHKVTVVPKASP